MLNLRRFCWIVSFIWLSVTHATPVASLDLLAPTLAPTCPAKYNNSVRTVGGQELNAPIGDFYCVASDGNWSAEKSAVLRQINNAAKQLGSVESVSISANYFDGVLVAQWLCSLNRTDRSTLELFVQNSDISILKPEAHVTAQFLDVVDACYRKIEIKLVGCDVHRPEAGCPSNATNSHHIKGIRINAQNGIVYAFGSGNFTFASMARNVENWLVGLASRPIAQLDCLFDFSSTLSAHPLIRYGQQRSIYDSCVISAEPLHNLRVMPLPFSERDFKAEFARLFAASKRVVLVGQFIESKWLFEMIRDTPSVPITLLVDASYYYASIDQSGAEYNFIDYDMAKVFFKAVETLPNVSVRYIMTNHNFASHGQTNTVHARSALFDGDAPAVLIGSVHWKDGAFVNNTEQEIFVYGDLASVQRSFMDDLLARSATMEQLPAKSTVALR